MTEGPRIAEIELTIRGLIVDPNSNMPVVILHDEKSGDLLPIWIGPCEATAIARGLDGSSTPRPMTHDLFHDTLHMLGYSLQKISIHSLDNSVFIASLFLEGPGGERREVDARPSDALALAVRAHAGVFVSEVVLEQARVRESTQEEALRNILENLDPDDLGQYEM